MAIRKQATACGEKRPPHVTRRTRSKQGTRKRRRLSRVPRMMGKKRVVCSEKFALKRAGNARTAVQVNRDKCNRLTIPARDSRVVLSSQMECSEPLQTPGLGALVDISIKTTKSTDRMQRAFTREHPAVAHVVPRPSSPLSLLFSLRTLQVPEFHAH